MKKGISLFLAAIVCLNFSVTALAAEDNFTTSDTAHDVYAKIQDVTKPVYSVSITWSSMCYMYERQAKWDADSLEYKRGNNGTWYPVVSKENDTKISSNSVRGHNVRVTNRSNAAIKVKVSTNKDKSLSTTEPRHKLCMPASYGASILYIPEIYLKHYRGDYGPDLEFGLRSAAIDGNNDGSNSMVYYETNVTMEEPTDADFKWLNEEYTIVGDVKVTLSAWDGIDEHFDTQ